MKNKIAEIRKARNLTQRKLAEKMGIAYQALQRYEKGTVSPTIETALRLSNILSVSVEELFFIED